MFLKYVRVDVCFWPWRSHRNQIYTPALNNKKTRQETTVSETGEVKPTAAPSSAESHVWAAVGEGESRESPAVSPSVGDDDGLGRPRGLISWGRDPGKRGCPERKLQRRKRDWSLCVYEYREPRGVGESLHRAVGSNPELTEGSRERKTSQYTGDHAVLRRCLVTVRVNELCAKDCSGPGLTKFKRKLKRIKLCLNKYILEQSTTLFRGMQQIPPPNNVKWIVLYIQ